MRDLQNMRMYNMQIYKNTKNITFIINYNIQYYLYTFFQTNKKKV